MDISVVIPSYNREKTIDRAIRSVYSQTVPVFEVIVVDDASTDNTARVVKDLQREFDNLRLFVQAENMGAQVARNVGIKKAKGDWIAFLDSDDEWLADKTEQQIKAMRLHPECGASFGDAYFYKDGIRIYHKCAERSKLIYDVNDMLLGTQVMFQALIVRKEIIESMGFLDPDVPSYQEWDAKIRISKKTPMLYVPTPLFIYYFDQDNSISKNCKKIDGFKYNVNKNKDLYWKNPKGKEFYYEGMFSRYREINSPKQIWYYTLMMLEKKDMLSNSSGRRNHIYEIQLNKMKEFYDLLTRWIELKHMGIGLDKYFIKHGYKTVAVYGMKEIGWSLVNELNETSIVVQYGIDRNRGIEGDDFRIIRPEDDLEDVDVIVVTAISCFEEIALSLQRKKVGSIVSIENVVYEL